MTANSINYARQIEDARHNVELERINLKVAEETERHNRATEVLGSKELKETVKHNRSTESIQSSNVQETIRHNTEYEAETKRHNSVMETLSDLQTQETVRHNQVSEQLNDFANQTARQNVGAAYINAEANRMNAQTRAGELTLSEAIEKGETLRSRTEIDYKDSETQKNRQDYDINYYYGMPTAKSRVFSNYISPLSGIISSIVKSAGK